ncbi:Usv1p KNAG_0D00900 [Huiozyma naganishii CBS 8797]|uniref:C2H2-type domain-containing protein n=1 Tax=Huiozyma naganishii (strain ATCC MYA-139 / BCRC 22969 / CBS 8797 / KCTC 17520 / NBRC 10181 / NCYC 3082 / Yp74L-3) TaxID=1071383 RepID=J7RXM3_HUIN7|nr:hypothetical protein KNAG_0D00900 [Kazachstania naganishii CBS 8797]CCK69842.1 hypothetical protein KNAG_0D00900 [Kazachstania naganishii CBS 8797]
MHSKPNTIRLYNFTPLLKSVQSKKIVSLVKVHITNDKLKSQECGTVQIQVEKTARKTKPFVCSGFGDCNMSFTRAEHLARHTRKHTGEKPFQCYICRKYFSRVDNLKQHRDSVHKKPFQTRNMGPSLGQSSPIFSSSFPLTSVSSFDRGRFHGVYPQTMKYPIWGQPQNYLPIYGNINSPRRPDNQQPFVFGSLPSYHNEYQPLSEPWQPQALSPKSPQFTRLPSFKATISNMSQTAKMMPEQEDLGDQVQPIRPIYGVESTSPPKIIGWLGAERRPPHWNKMGAGIDQELGPIQSGADSNVKEDASVEPGCAKASLNYLLK